MSATLMFERGPSAHNDWVKGYLDPWERVMPGGGYDKNRDFFCVHWQVDTPKGNQDPIPNEAHIVRLHVESPRHEDDPGLNDLKHDVIQGLLHLDLEQVVLKKKLVYEIGRKTSVAQIQENKTTEVFRVVLSAGQTQPTYESEIEVVHELVGDVVDAVLQRFADQLNQRFDVSPNRPIKTQGQTGH